MKSQITGTMALSPRFPLQTIRTSLLKHGGLLLLSDVCFMPGDGLRQLVENCGFSVLHQEDMTALWREYYIEALWAGTADCVPCGKKCTYQLLIGRKE